MRLRFRNNIYIPAMRRRLSQQLDVRDFTIISNNCWGGTVYETYNLPKLSPTVGMFIMPDDYVRFVNGLRDYTRLPLEFISPKDSTWADRLGGKANWGQYLIGRVGDVELHMLHYHDEASARRKWEARIGRINWDRLIFKFNDQNGATERNIEAFDQSSLLNKIVFAVRDYPSMRSVIRVPSPASHDYVRASFEPVDRGPVFNAARYINQRFGLT